MNNSRLDLSHETKSRKNLYQKYEMNAKNILIGNETKATTPIDNIFDNDFIDVKNKTITKPKLENINLTPLSVLHSLYGDVDREAASYFGNVQAQRNAKPRDIPQLLFFPPKQLLIQKI